MRTQWCFVMLSPATSGVRITACDEPPAAMKRLGQGNVKYYQAVDNVPDEVPGTEVAKLLDVTCDTRHLTDKRENKYELPPEPLQFEQLGLGKIVS